METDNEKNEITPDGKEKFPDKKLNFETMIELRNASTDKKYTDKERKFFLDRLHKIVLKDPSVEQLPEGLE